MRLPCSRELDSRGEQLSPQQAEYFRDSRVRDAQGRLKVMYHISDSGDIGVFQSGNSAELIYFAESEKAARMGARGSKAAYRVYLNAVNPVNENTDPVNWYDAEDSITVAEWKRNGYDGVYVKDESGVSFAVFSPEQIKRTDNQNPTADPDIRFSRELDAQYMTAVEAGDMETAQRMVDEAAKAAGYTVKAYHGTKNFGFTKFDSGMNFFAKTAGNAASYTPGDIRQVSKAAREEADVLNDMADITEWRLEKDDRFATVYDSDGEEIAYSNADDLGSLIAELLETRADELSDVPYQKLEYWRKYAGGGIYEVYLSLGDNPLTVDADGANWDEIWFDIGDGEQQYKTNDIGEWARKNGYSGVTIENVYDIGGETSSMAGKSDIYITFDSNSAKETAPVTYDDNGNVIPLSERFDPEKEDIRFSRNLPGETAELQDEYDELKKKLNYWKGQVKRTEVFTLREADTRRLTKSILSGYSSKADTADIGARIKKLGEYLMNGDGDGVSWVDAHDDAVRIARDIIQRASALVEDGERETYQQLKSYFHGLRIRVTDAKAKITDYNDFRRRNFGRFILTDDGTPIDALWDELQEMFGKGYFPDDIMTQTDQIYHVADLLDSLRDTYENPYQEYYAQAVEYCANDILDRLLSDEVRQTPKTFADRAEERLARQSIRYEDKLERQAEQLEERYQRRVLKDEERYQRVRYLLDQERENRKAQLEELRRDRRSRDAREREKRRAAALRTKIGSHARELTSLLLKPNDKRHIPKGLEKPVAALLSAIDLADFKTAIMEALYKGTRRNIESEPDAKNTEAE